MGQIVTPLEPAAVSDPVPGNLVEAGAYPTLESGFDHGLVVLATGNSYWLVPEGQSLRLLVEPREAEHIQQQLAKFDRESVGWPPPPVVHPPRPVEAFTPALWVLITLAAFWCESAIPNSVRALELDRTAVLARGEWWRPITALFLHADTGHLVSNLISGAFVFSAVTTTLGKWRGWLWIVVAAYGGNVLSLLSHSAEYRSLGASTAVFAALGLLTGRAIVLARDSAVGLRWRAATLPLVSGIVALGLYGAGAPNVDVGAHVCGFLCGTTLGWIGRKPSAPQTSSDDLQP